MRFALVLIPCALLWSCSNAPTCSTGCTDSNGQCQAGTSASACGSNGATCIACSGTQACSNGKCGASGSGGGSAGTGGGTASSGGGTAANGGGTASSGGGTASSGGGTASSGGGTAASGGGTAASGGGTASTGGGTAASGGGSGAGGGAACTPSPAGTCMPTECSTGNSINVGAYCTKGGQQCNQYNNNLSCAIDLSPDGANFCIKILCFSNSDCGAQACCTGDASQGSIKACVPMGCVVTDGGSACP
jgi:hypothetical protein